MIYELIWKSQRKIQTSTRTSSQAGTVQRRPCPGLCSNGYIVVPLTYLWWSIAAFLGLERDMELLFICFLMIAHAANGSADAAPTLLHIHACINAIKASVNTKSSVVEYPYPSDTSWFTMIEEINILWEYEELVPAPRAPKKNYSRIILS